VAWRELSILPRNSLSPELTLELPELGQERGQFGLIAPNNGIPHEIFVTYSTQQDLFQLNNRNLSFYLTCWMLP
jgi:hypothetical protein